MYRRHALQRLQLDQDKVLHDQVRPETLVERDALVRDGDRYLAGDGEAALAEDMGESDLVTQTPEAQDRGCGARR